MLTLLYQCLHNELAMLDTFDTESVAVTLYFALRKCADSQGKDINEVVLRKGLYWCVEWETGPYNWSFGASFITNLRAKRHIAMPQGGMALVFLDNN